MSKMEGPGNVLSVGSRPLVAGCSKDQAPLSPGVRPFIIIHHQGIINESFPPVGCGRYDHTFNTPTPPPLNQAVTTKSSSSPRRLRRYRFSCGQSFQRLILNYLLFFAARCQVASSNLSPGVRSCAEE